MTTPASTPTSPPASPPTSPRVFEVSQPAFSGPFDLLLSLIARKQLDITELALAEVADDFIAYLNEAGFDLDRATEFLVVAATSARPEGAPAASGRVA